MNKKTKQTDTNERATETENNGDDEIHEQNTHTQMNQRKKQQKMETNQ